MTTQRNDYPETTTVAARVTMGSQARQLVLVAYTYLRLALLLQRIAFCTTPLLFHNIRIIGYIVSVVIS